MQPLRSVLGSVLDKVNVEQLDELLVENANLIDGESAILVEDRGEAPRLHFPQATN